MAQYYKLRSLNKGDYQDAHGNYWCTAAFYGEAEPIRWVIKDPTTIEIEKEYYGNITDEVSKQGKAYRRFRREQEPEVAQTTDSKDEYWTGKNDSIRAQFAIKAALSKFETGCYSAMGADRMTMLHNIRDFARELYTMVDEVQQPAETVEAPPMTGYERAKAVKEAIEAKQLAESLDNGTPMPVDTTDYSEIDTEKPINLEDIPF